MGAHKYGVPPSFTGVPCLSRLNTLDRAEASACSLVDDFLTYQVSAVAKCGSKSIAIPDKIIKNRIKRDLGMEWFVTKSTQCIKLLPNRAKRQPQSPH